LCCNGQQRDPTAWNSCGSCDQTCAFGECFFGSIGAGQPVIYQCIGCMRSGDCGTTGNTLCCTFNDGGNPPNVTNVCVNPNTQSNCGQCGNDCGPAGQTCCKQSCVDTGGDNNNCGGCGVLCAYGKKCCHGGCTDLQTDKNNCGACDKVCDGFKVCKNGQCVDNDT
jgi:hypothetical protein